MKTAAGPSSTLPHGAPQRVVVQVRHGDDVVAVVLMLVAGVVQLAAFGGFPDGFRFAGDAALLLCIAYLAVRGRLKSLSNVCSVIAICLAAFALLQTMLTFFQWGEADKVLRQARRWIIAPTYYYLLATTLPAIFSKRTGRLILLGFVATVVIVVEAVRSGLSLPGASLAIMGIGSNTVYKVFIPGTVYLFLAVLILATMALASQLKVQARLGCAVLGLLLTAYAVTAIPFRGWVLALLLAAGAVLTVFTFTTSPKRTILSLVLVATSIGTTPFIAPNLFQQVELYYETAFGDMATGSGTIEYRRLRDVSRLSYFWDSASLLQKAIGAGFIHRDSTAASVIGYSSETNDSGWVEVILTGGVVGSLLLLAVYVSLALRFLSQFLPRKRWEPLACLAIWFFGGLLMYTSNPILWDFGFVPIATCILLLQGRLLEPHAISNAQLLKLLSAQSAGGPSFASQVRTIRREAV
ncbi:MAG: hypothetical protein QM757_09060 [Paludibaculum sp.]